MKKISVIVTVYNRMEYLKNLLICLMNQSIQVDELIIADDGSKEKVTDFINEMIPQCKFKIKHVYQEDKGFRLAKSRNNAVRASEGDILVFLDQDCIFSPTLIESVVKKLKKACFIPLKVIWSSEEEKDKIQRLIEGQESYKEVVNVIEKSKIKKLYKSHKLAKMKNIKYMIGLKDRGTNIVGAAFVFNREDYIRINGFDEEYINWGKEDDDISWRAYKSGLKSKLLYLEEPIIHMYHYSDPTKGGDMNEGLFNKKKALLNKDNFRCEYGYDNSLDQDEVKVKILN